MHPSQQSNFDGNRVVVLWVLSSQGQLGTVPYRGVCHREHVVLQVELEHTVV